MAIDKLCFLSLLLIQILLTRRSYAAYVGCFPEDQKLRQYSINPGDYDPATMTPQLCSAKCGAYKQSYAALAYGKFCFCGDAPPVSSVVDNDKCQEVCSGDALAKCGGKGYISLYGSASPITGLVISDSASGIVPVATQVTFTVSVASGSDVYYQMNYDDGAGLLDKNVTGFETRTYNVPGTYRVLVEANDFNNTLAVQQAVTTVTVQAPVSEVDLVCDPVFATFEEGHCTATVWEGTNMAFTTQIDSVSAETFSAIADPVLSQVGPGIPAKNSPSELHTEAFSGIVVSQASLVEYPGRVVGWELNVEVAGTFKVLILSPSCGGQVYCPLDNQCKSSCAGAAEVYATTCSGQNFCPRKRLCDDGTCTPPSRFTATAPTKIATYTVKAIVDVASTTGYQYIKESTILDVKPGDILGLDLGASGMARPYWVDSTSDLTDFTQVASPVSEGDTIATSGFISSGSKRMAIRAIVSEGSRVSLPYTFNTEKQYTLSVTARNNDIYTTDKSNSTTIDVLEGVNFTIINGPVYLKTNEAYTFTVEPHTGNEAVYTWDQTGDGVSPPMVNTSDQSKSLTYTSKGTYNLTVTVANAVSSKTNISMIVVQDEVTGLDVAQATAASNEPYYFNITLTGGSNYTCTWTFGDGATTTTDENRTPVGTSSYDHTYSQHGNKTFRVTCANDVSNQTKSMTQKVQERIMGLALSTNGQDKDDALQVRWNTRSGSDIHWTAYIEEVTLLVDPAQSTPASHSWISQERSGQWGARVYLVNISGSNDISSQFISQAYELTSAIKDFTATASTSNTTTGTTVQYTVSMSKGSNVNVSLDYKDGTKHSQLFVGEWASSQQETFDHTFVDGGRFLVVVTASNAAGSVSKTLEVIVLQGVSDIYMVSPDYALYAPPTIINVWFEVPPSRPKPTEPKLHLDFAYWKYPIVTGDLELNKNYSKQYDDIGEYEITSTVSNSLDSKLFSRLLVIIDILERPSISTASSKAPRNQDLDVTFSLFRGPSSPYCNLTWETESATVPIQTTLRDGTGENGKDTVQIRYTAVGTHKLKVTAATPLQTLSDEIDIDVVEPIIRSDLTLEPDPNSLPTSWPFGNTVQFKVTWNGNVANIPDNPKVSFSWGDGSSPSNDLPFSISKTGDNKAVSHAFTTEDGLLATTVIVHNEASSVMFNLSVGVYKQFLGMSFNACFVPDLPTNAICSSGLDVAGNFPQEKPVQITISTANNAKASLYEITQTTGSTTIVCNRTENPFDLDFTEPGNWVLTIRAWNPLYDETITQSIVIVQKVVGFNIIKNPGQDQVNPTRTFSITFTLQGHNTCLKVDFNDTTVDYYADDSTYCNIFNPGFSAGNLKGPLNGTNTISHTYSEQKTYSLHAIARTSYNSIEKTVVFEVTSVDCSQPDIVIEKAVTDFKNPKSFERGSFISFRGMAKIICQQLNNHKYWTIETVDTDWGNVTGVVNVASSGVNTTTAQLTLLPSTLDYNLYKASYSMSMDSDAPDLNFISSAYTYFKIVRSPLIGIMVEGGASKIERGTGGGNLVLTPLNFSHDPDVSDTGPADTGFSVVNWTCTYSNGSTATPCSDLESSAGSQSELNYDITQLTLGETYRISVTLLKDKRYVVASVDVHIVAGDPVKISLKCIASSICYQLRFGYMVLTSESLRLTTVCDNCIQSEQNSYIYEWSIFVSAYRWPDRWRKLSDLDASYIVGLNSFQISLTPYLFGKYSSYLLYKIECRVTRGGVTGSASVQAQMQRAPSGGNCTVSTQELVYTSAKSVQIHCTDWTADEETSGDLTFMFYAQTHPTRPRITLATVDTSDGNLVTNVSLPLGSEDYDFNVKVYTEIVDNLLGSTSVNIGTVKDLAGAWGFAVNQGICQVIVTRGKFGWNAYQMANVQPIFLQQIPDVKVLPPAQTENIIDRSKTVLDRRASEGDIKSFTEEAGSVLSVLNNVDAYEGDSAQKDSVVEQTKRNEKAKLRFQIMKAADSFSLQTPDDVNNVLSMTSQAVEEPGELTTSAQKAAVNVLKKSLKAIQNIPVDFTSKQLTRFLDTALDINAYSGVAVGTGGQDATIDEQEEASDSVFNYVNTDNEAPPDTCLKNAKRPDDIDMAIKDQKCEAHCKEQQEFARSIVQEMRENEDLMVGIFAENSIDGSSHRSSNPVQETVLLKSKAGDIFADEVETNASSCDFPPLHDLFPGNTVGENDSIIVMVSESSGHPLQDLEEARYARAPFTKINLYDGKDSKQKIGVTYTTQPIIIKMRSDADIPVDMVDPLLPSWNKFMLHKTAVTAPGFSLRVNICAQKSDVQYVVVFNLLSKPEPALGACKKAFLVPHYITDPNRSRCANIGLDNYKLDGFVGDIYLGIRQLNKSEENMDVSNCTQLPHWDNGTDTATQFTGNYTLEIFSSCCYVLEDDSTVWNTNSCRVHENTSASLTVCECNHLTTFAGGWVVVPNTIDWDFVFNNASFFKNPTLYITEIVIAVVYILAFVWARRKDKKDVEQLGIAPLMDNDPKDKYYYEIVVVTGMRRNAGTDSKVFFILSGEEDETDVREFSDSKRKIFRRGGTNGFLMATSRPLGYLNYARVWHDNSGKGNMGGWYLNYMIVRDVQTDEKWVFIADKWFAVEEDDGQVDRIIPVATRETMTDFGHMFAERSRKNLADGHLWFSVVARPPASRFTCVQRVSCCLCLLYVSMLTNAMFYRKGSNDSGTSNGITFGPFSISPEQIFIGVISNLIVFPVNFIIITLFRKARPRKLRPSRVDEAIKIAHDGPRTEASVTDIKPEVSSIFSVSRPSSTMANPKPPRPESSLSRPGTSLSTRADATLPTKKKKVKDFPWWCRIVAWVILWLSTLVALAFVTFYGISFADETCKKWISSMLISFFMSVFITQPIKVFMLAIFLSLIIKNPGEEEDEEEVIDEEKTKLANDEIPLHELNSEGYGAARPRKIGYKPPDRSTLEAARQKRLNEIQMWAIVREVVIYSFFLWILLVISYRQRNSDTFLYKDTMERVFIKNNETNIDFEKIRNAGEYWNWTRSGLVNGIRAGEYYNDFPPVLLRGYVNDKVSKILGYATMRQLRVRPSLCEMDERIMALVRECNVGYSIGDQEEGTFDIGWKPRTENSTASDTADWYSYSTANSLNGYPYWGQLSVYSGGGYVVPLKGSKNNLITLMDRLESEEWVDRYTRAVFVEFTIYNAQVNLFGIATILAEFHATGGIVQSYRFEPAMLLPYMTSAMLFQLVCEGVYCCFILFFIFRLFKTFFKEKLSFFKGFWNLVEIGIIAMSLGAIIIYFYRLFETNKLTNQFKETNGLGYIKFQYVGYWNEIFTYMIAWTVFFATLKFMRLLRFNKRMSLLASTLRNGARSLLHFSIIFWIVFLAFAMLFFLSFMTIDIKYSSFIGSVVSGILMMMGKFDIYTMTMAEPVLTQLFVFLFVVSVTFIIVNMFVSILNETFSAVRDDVSKQSNDYEIISFMLSRFKRFTGMGTQPQTTLTPEELRNQELEKRYAEGDVSSCVDDFPERIDRLLHSISNVYMDQDPFAAMKDKRGYQHGGATAKGYDTAGYRHGGPGKGYDNPGYLDPRSQDSSMSKVHTH